MLIKVPLLLGPVAHIAQEVVGFIFLSLVCHSRQWSDLLLLLSRERWVWLWLLSGVQCVYCNGQSRFMQMRGHNCQCRPAPNCHGCSCCFCCKVDDHGDDDTMLLQCRKFHFAMRGKYTLLATRLVLLTIVHSTRSELTRSSPIAEWPRDASCQ